MVNVDLLRRTMGAVQAADKVGLWNQREWSSVTPCGTAYCFAGHALLLDGWTLEEPGAFLKDGITVSASVAAHCALGLTLEQGGRLFWKENTMDELAEIVGDICREEAGA